MYDKPFSPRSNTCYNPFAFKAISQSFIHLGINQTAKDLEYMKQSVLKGSEPWKAAFIDSKIQPIL